MPHLGAKSFCQSLSFPYINSNSSCCEPLLIVGRTLVTAQERSLAMVIHKWAKSLWNALKIRLSKELSTTQFLSDHFILILTGIHCFRSVTSVKESRFCLLFQKVSVRGMSRHWSAKEKVSTIHGLLSLLQKGWYRGMTSVIPLLVKC